MEELFDYVKERLKIDQLVFLKRSAIQPTYKDPKRFWRGLKVAESVDEATAIKSCNKRRSLVIGSNVLELRNLYLESLHRCTVTLLNSEGPNSVIS